MVTKQGNKKIYAKIIRAENDKDVATPGDGKIKMEVIEEKKNKTGPNEEEASCKIGYVNSKKRNPCKKKKTKKKEVLGEKPISTTAIGVKEEKAKIP